MKWVLFGGQGQLGRCLQEELQRQQIEFKAFGRRDIDVTNLVQVSNCLRANKPSIVVNLAAWTDVDGAEDHEKVAFAVNATGAENIALACAGSQSQLIHISTDYVFDGAKRSPYLTTDTTNPLGVYGFSKLEGEQLVLSAHPSGTWVVRTAWLYSQYGKNFAKTILKRALAGGSLSVVNDSWGQPTSASDLSRQLITLAKASPSTGIFHATNSGQASWFDFASQLVSYLNHVPEITAVNSDVFPTIASRPKYSVLDHTSWFDNGLPEMQDWRTALDEVISDVILAVRKESEQ